MACSTGEHTGIFSLHPDILETHILTRLDGPTLASTSCASTQLRSLSAQNQLWTDICTSTWPSTNTPRLRHLISTFPDGPRTFFSASYPILHHSANSPPNSNPSSPPVGLISAVDIYYKDQPIISRLQETETATEWFRRSPFRIDVLGPKDEIPTSIQHPEDDETCRQLAEDISLSWTVIDPTGRRAVNLSSHKAVSVERHWLSGDVQLRFASILAGNKGTKELVQCGIIITCAGSKSGELHVREVSLQFEDMDGIHLMGKQCLAILNKTLEGQRVKKVERRGGGKDRYNNYLKMKKEREERKARLEGTLDTSFLSVITAMGVLAFSWVISRCIV